MSPRELRASLSLAAIFGLRLFGMFVILPVFALWAEGRPGWNLTLVGIALGVYGLTQAILQIPFGYWSDRSGRKPVLYIGLAIMACGSFVGAGFESPWMVILGRMLQGAGAVSAVAIAMAGDLTRDSQRTKAMAIIGSSIGAAFALSFVLAPFLEHAIGVRGLFAMTGVFCILAMGVVAWVVPDVEGKPAERQHTKLGAVLRDAELVRINIGIFILRMVLMAVFVVVPMGLVAAGAPAKDHWWVYLVSVGGGFLLMLPVVMGQLGQRDRPVVIGAIATLGISIAALAASEGHLAGLVVALVIFFAGFNALEAKLPAMVSRAAPASARGLATGVFSSIQFLGMFAGGSLGGLLAQRGGMLVVLGACFAAVALWLLVASRMGNFVPIK
ncbi:Inner membrane transport protein YajR [Usitatibacter rugosus]|uniref:Inner membrane transport protein YajR n=2 Tax=Usitatibacter rugosus TaxID=2732067 RepID=A0A6M4H089_9PROT|nr:Inner membrane transport protein YajR [Usitatibacter rugosus]